jgi:hypothetical protein
MRTFYSQKIVDHLALVPGFATWALLAAHTRTSAKTTSKDDKLDTICVISLL